MGSLVIAGNFVLRMKRLIILPVTGNFGHRRELCPLLSFNRNGNHRAHQGKCIATTKVGPNIQQRNRQKMGQVTGHKKGHVGEVYECPTGPQLQHEILVE